MSGEDYAKFFYCLRLDFIIRTSIHLEYASTMTRKLCPSKGPAKSKCNLDHGLLGHFHGCNGAVGGDGRDI